MSRNSWKMCDSATGLMARVQLSGEFGHQRNQSRSWKDLSICRHFLHNFYLEMRSLVVVQIHPEQKKWCHDWGLQILTRTNISSGCHKCSKKQSFTAGNVHEILPWFRIGVTKCQALIRSNGSTNSKKQKERCKGSDKRPWTCSAIVCHLVWQTTTWIFWEKCVCVCDFSQSTYPKSLQQIGWAHLCFGKWNNKTTQRTKTNKWS